MDEPRATIEDVEAEAGRRPAADDRPHDSRVDPSDLTIAMTPRQILGGFALLAALVMLLRRGRKQDR